MGAAEGQPGGRAPWNDPQVDRQTGGFMTGTIVELTTPELRVELDPERGGVISSVVARAVGVELLFRAPWQPAPLDLADSDERAWTTAWQGGWNVLFPSAGAASEIDGRRHPFHGVASITPWTVLAQSTTSARLHWQDGHGLTLRRDISVAAGTLRVDSRVGNEGERQAPYMLVEHLILGGDVLGSSVLTRVEGARVVELANEGHRISGREDEWPRIIREGQVNDWSRRPPDRSARFGALHTFADRTVHVDVPDRGLRLRLSWSAGFPYLWFWEERRSAEAPPWERRAVCLGLEPATAPTGEGLAATLARGQTPVLDPGEEARYTVELEVAS